MGYVHDHIAQWSKMSFKENPYGEPIPLWILAHEALIRSNKWAKTNGYKKSIGDFKQDGNITTKVINDPTKKVDWEKEETISFSKIFRDLLDKETLCPSNFARNVIFKLHDWDLEHNQRHSHMFFIGTVARGCRSFASLMREQHLIEIIDEHMTVEAAKKGKYYVLRETTVTEDMKNKTDIIFEYDGNVYRIWSYQTTEAGIEHTSERVLKACGKGYNILMPFNDNEKEVELGWWLYDKDRIHNILKRFVLDRDFEPISVKEYQKLVKIDPDIIKMPAIFKI